MRNDKFLIFHPNETKYILFHNVFQPTRNLHLLPLNLRSHFSPRYNITCSIGEGTTYCANSAEMFREGSIFCCDLNNELPTTNCTCHRTHIQQRSLNVYETNDLPQAHNTKWKLQHYINKTQVSLLPIWRKQIPNNKMFKCTHTLILELLWNPSNFLL